MQSEHPAAQLWSNPAAIITVAILVIVAIAAWWLTDAIPQDPGYHSFADQRKLISIPHARNVLSNLPFCLVGLLGIFRITTRPSQRQAFDAMYLTFFVAIIATGFGSAYYHFNPDNLTLVWDRLPMAVGFMSIFAIVIGERTSLRHARALFPWLLAAGIGSVVYWHWQDDLRPYVLVQFGTLLALPLILLIYRRPDSGLLWLAIAFYALAKVFETVDEQIFVVTANWLSGHSLKHLAASITPLLILIHLGRSSNIHGNWAATTRATINPETQS